jgi:hypothetical protein
VPPDNERRYVGGTFFILNQQFRERLCERLDRQGQACKRGVDAELGAACW